MHFSQIRKRNLEDQLLLYGAGSTFMFVFPFALYRLITGDFFLGVIDSIVSLLLVIVFLQTWHSKKLKHFNTIVVIGLMAAILGVIYLKSTEMIFWAYPVIAASYFLLKARSALYINCLFIISVGAIAFHFKGLPIISVFPSLFLVSIFGFSFSLRAESQTKKLLRLASEDVLTQVNNRRSFDEKMEEVLAQKKRSSNSVCLLLLDLDFFKKINDSHGHKQGDKVLFNFAQTVKMMIRNTDFIYRFGGEEFAIIATNSTLENAGLLADNIRETVQNTPSLSEYNVTVSIGVSEIKLTDDADSCFRRADLALYQSKSKGRNRVYCAGHDDGSRNSTNSTESPNLKIYPFNKTSSSESDSIDQYNNYQIDLTTELKQRKNV